MGFGPGSQGGCAVDVLKKDKVVCQPYPCIFLTVWVGAVDGTSSGASSTGTVGSISGGHPVIIKELKVPSLICILYGIKI